MSSVPQKLYELQTWFGGTITKTPDSDVASADHYIVSTPVLSASFRMEIYKQSYWLRLLAALHEEYPFLSRLFGKEAFDQEIGIDYLRAHPPTHWSLNLLGKNLATWLKGHYQQQDSPLVHTAAQIDWACQQSFFAPSKQPLDLALYAGDAAYKLLEMPLALAPDVVLIEAASDLMPFRQELLQQEHDYWLSHDFPKLAKDGPYHYLIYRKSDFNIAWERLEQQEYHLLQHIQQGSSIDEALEKEDVGEEVAFWVQKWLLHQWLIENLSLQK